MVASDFKANAANTPPNLSLEPLIRTNIPEQLDRLETLRVVGRNAGSTLDICELGFAEMTAGHESAYACCVA